MTARRVAARVLLLDTAGRVLLLRGHDPRRPLDGSWWFTPGGGLDDGEPAARAAIREVLEETGFVVEVTGPVAQDVAVFDFEGERYEQHQQFFLARVPGGPLDISRWTAIERRTVLGWRWWTVAELRATTEAIYPAHLADLVPG